MSERYVSWFSCGIASAAAAKVAIQKYGSDCTVVYCDTMASEHPDNRRFFREVQSWLGRDITTIRSAKYVDIDDVFRRTRYMSGIAGARCTTELKKLPREAFQRESDVHVFGYTAEEQRRANTFERNNPSLAVEWVLIEAGLTKADCVRMVADAGIAPPAMYALGFDHNNCIGCPKATSPGYWNRVRKHFPDVFDRRAKQCRDLGTRLVRVGGKRVFLDQIPPDIDAPDDDIECGPVCQTPRAPYDGEIEL